MKPQRTIVERKAINQVRMAMLQMAGLNLKVLFPMLNAGVVGKGVTKNPHNTKKGPGRYRPNVEEISARLALKAKKAL